MDVRRLGSLACLILFTSLAAGQQPPKVDDAALRNAGKTGDGTHYSPLKQIDADLVYIPTSTNNTYAAADKFDPLPGNTTGTVRPAWRVTGGGGISGGTMPTAGTGNAGPQNVATENPPRLLTFVLDGTGTLEQDPQ